mmetsp:Transcript_59235/g.144824  ORF Transcript_59235/g.144824 Transcript_59235/m.144824 type:complete len:86 (-) Transcript_59235:114-371(-)
MRQQQQHVSAGQPFSQSQLALEDVLQTVDVVGIRRRSIKHVMTHTHEGSRRNTFEVVVHVVHAVHVTEVHHVVRVGQKVCGWRHG